MNHAQRLLKPTYLYLLVFRRKLLSLPLYDKKPPRTRTNKRPLKKEAEEFCPPRAGKVILAVAAAAAAAHLISPVCTARGKQSFFWRKSCCCSTRRTNVFGRLFPPYLKGNSGGIARVNQFARARARENTEVQRNFDGWEEEFAQCGVRDAREVIGVDGRMIVSRKFLYI